MKKNLALIGFALIFSAHFAFSETVVKASAVSSCSKIQKKITTPKQYVEALKCPELANQVRVNGLFGRVLKGKTETDFASLSDDPKRKLIFLMGDDGLEKLIGLRSDQIFEKIGYTHEYVERLKKEGYRFKVVMFKSKGDDVRLATWDNVANLVEKQYPELTSKVKRVLPELKKSSFSQIEAQAPTKFSVVDKTGESHPDFFDEEKLRKSGGRLWQVRAFLFYRVRLMDLYAGDGYSRTSDGQKGLKEYMMLNAPVSSLAVESSVLQ